MVSIVTLVPSNASRPRFHSVNNCLRWGNQALERGKFGVAASEFKSVLSRDRSKPEAHIGMARMYWETGHVGYAEEAFRVAMKLSPENLEAKQGLEKTSNPELIRQQLARFQPRLYTKASLTEETIAWAELLFEQRKFKEAEGLFQTLKKDDPRNRSLKVLEGLLLFHEGKWNSAQEILRDVAAKKRDNDIVLGTLARILMKQGDLKTALRYLQQAVYHAPDRRELHEDLLAVYQQLNDQKNIDKQNEALKILYKNVP